MDDCSRTASPPLTQGGLACLGMPGWLPSEYAQHPRPPPWPARSRDQPDTGSNSPATVLSRCQNLQDDEQMVRSIDPRRGTLRLSQWPPIEVAVLFGTPVAETILVSVHVRAHQRAGHMDASDLIKALHNTLRGGGRPHMARACSCGVGGSWSGSPGSTAPWDQCPPCASIAQGSPASIAASCARHSSPAATRGTAEADSTPARVLLNSARAAKRRTKAMLMFRVCRDFRSRFLPSVARSERGTSRATYQPRPRCSNHRLSAIDSLAAPPVPPPFCPHLFFLVSA